MFRVAFSITYRAWKLVVWVFIQIAGVIITVLNSTMFPEKRTGQAHPKAMLAWGAINIFVFVGSAYGLSTRAQAWTGFGLASLHFLIIVTVLLVISEENDIWSGYVRYDRADSSMPNSEHRDFRAFKRGKVVKSFWLITVSTVSYLAFLAIAVRGLHSNSNILTVRFSSSISIWSYIVTVAAQVPIFDNLVEWIGKWTDLRVLMEFHGLIGTAIKLLIHVSNVSIILGTFNSYFRQKSQIRRLMEGLASEKGDIPFLQLQAQRAPNEIKSAIIEMAIKHPEARMRRRAMAVAPYLNILTFPHTMVHNLHKESDEQNKRRAMAVSIEIIRNNLTRLEPAFIRLLQRKINFQINDLRKYHSKRVLGMLIELQSILPNVKRLKRTPALR